MSYRLTKSQIKKEILQCGRNPAYFINNYVKVSHPMKDVLPFNLYDFQETLVDDFQNYRFNIVLKARQLGISTTSAAYVAWLILFHRNKNVVVMATKLSTAANLVKKVKFALKHAPEWMMISQITVDNKNSFELDNGSQVKAISTSGDAGRSEALSLLVIDEAAIIEGMDELWAGLYPTLSTGGNCIIVSTPKGVGNLFHKLYSEAEQGLNDFNAVKLPWQLHPDRDQEWFEKETKNMSRREIAQELECNFNMSGDTLIHGDDLTRIREKELEEPKYKTGFDRNLWIWDQYEDGKKYFLSADVARGDGRDRSTMYVFDSVDMRICVEYQGKLPLDMFAQMIYDTSSQYGGCLTVVENNSIGIAVLNKLKEMGHRNIYHSKKSTHQYVDQHLAEQSTAITAGFSTTVKTRPLIIAKLEEMIRNKAIKIRSKRLFNELKTFIWNNGKAEAMRSYNDDLVLAAAIGCWVRETALVVNEQDAAYKKVMLNSIMTSNKSLDTRIVGQQGVNRGNRHIYRDKNRSVVKITDLPFFLR
tara:strand:+ start:1467 stop:3059 length:1593 start_codon:yes stop_codon:yes gene_type:complete